MITMYAHVYLLSATAGVTHQNTRSELQSTNKASLTQSTFLGIHNSLTPSPALRWNPSEDSNEYYGVSHGEGNRFE